MKARIRQRGGVWQVQSCPAGVDADNVAALCLALNRNNSANFLDRIRWKLLVQRLSGVPVMFGLDPGDPAGDISFVSTWPLGLHRPSAGKTLMGLRVSYCDSLPEGTVVAWSPQLLASEITMDEIERRIYRQCGLQPPLRMS